MVALINQTNVCFLETVFMSNAAWPDVVIEIGPKFPKGSPKVAEAFFSKSHCFRNGQNNFVKIWVNFVT